MISKFNFKNTQFSILYEKEQYVLKSQKIIQSLSIAKYFTKNTLSNSNWYNVHFKFCFKLKIIFHKSLKLKISFVLSCFKGFYIKKKFFF